MDREEDRRRTLEGGISGGRFVPCSPRNRGFRDRAQVRWTTCHVCHDMYVVSPVSLKETYRASLPWLEHSQYGTKYSEVYALYYKPLPGRVKRSDCWGVSKDGALESGVVNYRGSLDDALLQNRDRLLGSCISVSPYPRRD